MIVEFFNILVKKIMKKKLFYIVCLLISIGIYVSYSPFINTVFTGRRFFIIQPGEKIQIEFPDQLDRNCQYEIYIKGKPMEADRDVISQYLKKNLAIYDEDQKIEVVTKEMLYSSANAFFNIPLCSTNKKIQLELIDNEEKFKDTDFVIHNYSGGKIAVYDAVYSLWLFLIAILPLLVILTYESISRTLNKRKKFYYILSVLIIIIDITILTLILMPFL